MKNFDSVISTIRDVKFGSGVKIIEPSNLYECEIGNNSFIGPFVEIQKGAKIGSHTKVQSHTFICELVSIGNHCFIGHGVVFINDTFVDGKPANGNKKMWKKTTIYNNVSIGSNSSILPVSIAEGTVIGAGSVVTKDIHIKGKYAGNPAKLIERL